MAGINFGNTPYGSRANFRVEVAALPKPDLEDGFKKQNDPSVKPNSTEPPTGNGGLSPDQVDALKAKILAQPKPDLPPVNADSDYKSNKPDFGGIA